MSTKSRVKEYLYCLCQECSSIFATVFTTMKFNRKKYSNETLQQLYENQLKEIRKNPEGIKFEIPTDKKEKFHQLYDLVHMMSVDNAIHDEEAKLSVLFAIKFGYPRMNVKELVDTIRLNIQHGQSHDETMKRVTLLIG